MQQATLNLFADMGVQPRTRAPGLAAAAASSDALPPTAVVTTPADTVKIRRKVVIRGTAADAGGVVAAVEVSVDGGRTWHMASGQESWSFTWIPPAPGSYAVLVRAVDDSLNLGEATAGPIFIAVAPPLTRARVVAADALRGVAQASVAALRSGRRFRQRLRLRQRLRGAAFRVRRGARRLRDAVGRTAARRALP